MANLLKTIQELILDFILPINCLGCSREKDWLCQNCLNSIPLIDKFTCPNCQKVSLAGQTCIECRYKTPLSGLVAAVSYNQPLVRQAIHKLKYDSIFALAKPLGQLLIKILSDSPFHLSLFKEQNFLLIPIPLHQRKLSERGFNQSELLAQEISRKFGWPMETEILKRIRYTKSQTELKEKERLTNVKDAFAVSNPSIIKNRNVILVDDLFTTGATMKETAKVLKRVGAKKIWGLVLARG